MSPYHRHRDPTQRGGASTCQGGVHDTRHDRRRSLLWGGALIVIGLVWLGWGAAAFEPHPLWRLGLALLALSGWVKLLLDPRPAAKWRGAWRVLLAGYGLALLEQWWGWTLASTWPVLLMAVGASVLLRGLFDRSATPPQEPRP
jgi:hypothetical protein